MAAAYQRRPRPAGPQMCSSFAPPWLSSKTAEGRAQDAWAMPTLPDYITPMNHAVALTVSRIVKPCTEGGPNAIRKVQSQTDTINSSSKSPFMGGFGSALAHLFLPGFLALAALIWICQPVKGGEPTKGDTKQVDLGGGVTLEARVPPVRRVHDGQHTGREGLGRWSGRRLDSRDGPRKTRRRSATRADQAGILDGTDGGQRRAIPAFCRGDRVCHGRRKARRLDPVL